MQNNTCGSLRFNSRQEGVGGRVKILKAVTIAVFMFSTLPVKAVWTTYGTDYGWEIWASDFINANTGWIVGANGRIQKTVNGGLSWQWQGGFTEVFRNIKMFDINNGIISGHNGIILKTSNSGLSWSQSAGMVSFYGMDAFDSQNIICVGSNKNYSKTTDGGVSWTHGVINAGGVGAHNFDIYGIEYLDLNTILLSSSVISALVIPVPVILRSTNGGNNFSVVASWGYGDGFDNASLNDIEFSPSGNVGFACGSNGTIIRSSNGGVNWSVVMTSASDLRQIEFKNNDTAFVCGSGGQVFKTANGGINWTSWPNTGTPYNLRTISYADNFVSSAGVNGTFIRNNPVAAQVTVSGANTGNGNYESLSDAFNGIGAGSQSGANINITINTNITEPQQGATPGNGDWASVTIKPAANTAITVTATPNNGVPLFSFNGAKNITIDGIDSGGASLTLSNSSTSGWAGTSTVLFQYDATNNKVKNCRILGSSQNNLSGHAATVLFYRNSSATGNDNNVIENCDIGPAGQLPHCAVSFLGSTTNTTVYNSNDTVRNCKIYDYFNVNGNSAGIYIGAGNTGIAIENNRLYQTSSRVASGLNLNHNGIFVNNTNGNAFSIKGNTIGYSSSAGTGVYSANLKTGSYFYGIFLSAGVSAQSSISNNTIAGLDISGTSAGVNLINVQNGFTIISNNTIGSMTALSDIKYASGTSELHVFKIEGSGSKTVSDNKAGGIRYSASSSKFYGMRFIAFSNDPIIFRNNTLGGAAANSLQHHLANTSSQMTGISCEGAGSPALLIENNLIRNMNSAATNANPGTSGIYINLASGNQTVRNNTVHSLSITNTSSVCNLSGIRINNGINGIAASNKIHSLIISNSVSSLSGITISSGTYDFVNNMISLGKDSSGANMTGGSTIFGINIGIPAVSNLYYNSVYISGNPAGVSMNTYALASFVSSNQRNYYNNIFYNGRSNSGSIGKHYAVRLEGTSPNPPGLLCNHNDLLSTGNGGVLGFYNSADVLNLSAWKLVTGKDSNSVSDNPRFKSHTDLHIDSTMSTSISNGGLNIAAITTDIDSNIRNVSNPDIGCDEFNSAVTAEALNFDGINDYVSLPISLSQALTAPAVSEFTIEYWFKGSNLQSAVRFQMNSSTYIVAGWGTPGNQKHLISTEGFTNGISVGSGADDGNWHHIAMTWKRNTINGFKSYLDGALIQQRNSVDANLPSLSVAGILGSQFGSSEFMNGSLDEVRIWTRALSQFEIAANMYQEIDSASGLLASYHFNQGIADGNNSGLTTLTETSSNNFSGTLTNFDLNGTVSNWVKPGPGFCSPYIEVNVQGNGITINDGDLSPSFNDHTIFDSVNAGSSFVRTYTVQNVGADSLNAGNIIITGADSGMFTAGALIPAGKIPPGSSATFSVTFTPGNSGQKNAVVHILNSDCNENDYDFAVRGYGKQSSAQVLNFDGINDNVELPVSLSQNLTSPAVSEITIEYWFKGTNLQSAVRFQSPNKWIVAGWGAPGNQKHIISTEGGTDGINVGADATDGSWHHVAMTWKKNTLNGFKSYLDGELVDQKNSSDIDLPLIEVSGYLGRYNAGSGEYLQGSLDEVRIWTRELSQAEIAANMLTEINSGPGLLASYHFNQGLAGENNSAITTLNDAANNYHGALANFELNGITSNWISPGPELSEPLNTINIAVISEGYYNPALNLQSRKDTLKVYLCQNLSPYNAIDSSVGIIDSVSHSSEFTFLNAPAGSYYLKLVHRNCIETWSAMPVNIPSVYNYDFTSSLSQAFGNNMKQVNTSPDRFAIYSGDVNQDGVIDLADGSLIDNDAFNFASGYLPTDVNGDGVIDLADGVYADNNGFNFVSKIAP
ncbi:MAG TPA: choice-of-anchor D domain-containing protein [Ignavibacteria bacterium]|nr:choice-of-anchor D domain-containing protein [Ignavibacteria bacterium]